MSDYQKREAKAVDAIKKAIPLSLKKDMIRECKGLFCELYENNEVCPNHYIATACDGVGTKLILAEAMGIYDTVGIDLVAMNSNDMATFGQVNPFLFINYIATQHMIQEKGLTGDIIKGMLKGLEMSDAADVMQNSIHINLGKGETASVDELISATKPGYGFDVAGAMIGFIKKDALNIKISPGDKIVALQSSGPHSNGYTDLRLKLLNGDFETRPEYKKAYTGRFKLNDKFENTTIGKALLEPTRIYVKPMAAIAKKFKVVGANNTGYGLKNLNRYTGNFEFVIDDPIKPQPIFDLVQKEAKFTDEEMYKKFNMGMGFFIIAKKEDADSILSIAEKFKENAKVVGEVKAAKETRTVLEKDGKKIVFEGY
ncbi:AIR synthase-related protein [Nanoarchaeota archaeon]